MLAGRKLLLADDSVTIQKVIDLTFADEGVRVITFGNGQEAIDNLEKVAPDIVLADVFMPLKTGYDVCEYVKGNEKLKHIPVMLLVGSFEPFDEEEARRVGANDILTKPFQSIRRLIDRVGSLVSNQPPEQEVPTAELPKPEHTPADEQRLTTEELEISTADTLQLSEEASHKISEEASQKTTTELREVPAKPKAVEERMETATNEAAHEFQVEPDGLLDLGELEPRSVADEDVVLDLGIEEAYTSFQQTTATGHKAFVEPAIAEVATQSVTPFYETPQPEYAPFVSEVNKYDVPGSMASSASQPYDLPQYVSTPTVKSTGSLTQSTPDNLSPEMIDAIARRAVEMLSEKVIREIAWEVVPELAELMIKRQLEESQPK